MTLLSKLNVHPPFMVRVLARKPNGKPMSGPEIAALAGMNADMVRRLSRLTSWESVSIGTASRFMIGCRYDPFHAKNHNRYVRRMATVANPRIFKKNVRPYYERLIGNAEAQRRLGGTKAA